VGKRPALAGAHRPIGVFAAKGPGIRAGADGGTLSILDVAPILLHSLGLAVPEGVEGRVPQEIFTPDFAAAHPVRHAARKESSTPATTADNTTMRPEDEQIVLERLRELGYIE
jgi:predicted AlkP superfamily phosphohydrolase/phosphomutase